MSAPEPLSPLRLPLAGTQLIEASAGTGKTWTIAALYLRLVLGHGRAEPLLPAQILVMTFTKAATAELRERIRERLAEAAGAFRGQRMADDFLHALIAEYPDDEARTAAARKLELASQWMDEAAVFTIHSWCQRMLVQHAFDSGEAASEDGIADENELLAEAVRDYWRRFFFPLDREAAGLVAQLWKEPDALRRAVKPLLAGSPDTLRLGGQPVPVIADPADMLDAATASLRDAEMQARTLWREHGTEIAQLMRDAVEGGALNAASYKTATLATDHAAFDAWNSTAELAKTKTLERHSTTKLQSATRKNQPTPTHAFFAAIDAVLATQASTDTLQPLLLAHAATWIAQRLDETRRSRAVLGYDDMLKRLATALHGANGDALTHTIAVQYPAALVDEFQDTDPLQWRSLQRIYGGSEDTALLLIGDPKQAIYGFRGADIHTYLRARESAARPHWTLDTNHRSSKALVAAVNRVFGHADTYPQGAFCFGTALPFVAVKAKGRNEVFQLDGEPLPAMQMAVHPSVEPASMGAWRESMAAHAAAQLVAWLGAAQAGRSGFMAEDGALAPLRPGDIAILVRDRTDAAAMADALHRRGLAHVYLSDQQSVYASDEATDLLRWLHACARPGNDRAMRAALATPSMARNLAELASLDDDTEREACDEHFRQSHALWQRHGVLAMLHELLHRFDLPARLLARDGGERALTNLLHLAELLQQAATGLDGEHALIRFLAAQIASPGSGESAEAQLVRLESEAALIKLVTVHKSKGLEYPVVLLPFACGFREVDADNAVQTRDSHGRAQLDLQPDEDALREADRERLQEDLRLLYVALTRARHACWLGVANLKHGNRKDSDLHKSAFGYVLAGGAPIAPTELLAHVRSLAGEDTPIQVVELADLADEHRHHDITSTALTRPARSFSLKPAEPWWIASYSALAHGDDSAAPRHAPETAGQSTLAENVASSNAEASDTDAHGIHAFHRGANAGTFLHDLLESCADEGFARAAAPSVGLRDTIARRCQARGWQSWIKPLTAWLPALLHTPLPLPDDGAMPLAALADAARYRAELEFWFEANRVDAAALDRIVTAHTLDGLARPPLPPHRVNGMLKGFIDLVFEHQGRWYVVDYKSNWLGGHAAAYTAEAMRDSVLQSRYDLQYAIYTLALHRQLKARLPGYDYERHMGGVLYLYLRGVDGEGHGVHGERLPFALVDALDRLFATGGTAHAA
ncbi:exodeoxyribonuclease V subunit beta [Rhodanobacter sp. DHG33]|uniref:exodeoxyribonuclease V subunit beta n=1 Tax=Rhodanobacter sp. DHG33 TaxID=2775921 RepID=UPI001786061C|nr:exodeoxyribonuclease V subunit beta [Rhodanobacter sp. DHG33]MBD8899038.1 exodeoxyribonuclease V subunit beta [Rhodanobacter sp. DHG33]